MTYLPDEVELEPDGWHLLLLQVLTESIAVSEEENGEYFIRSARVQLIVLQNLDTVYRNLDTRDVRIVFFKYFGICSPKTSADTREWRQTGNTYAFSTCSSRNREIKHRVSVKRETSNGRLLLVIKASKLSYSNFSLSF